MNREGPLEMKEGGWEGEVSMANKPLVELDTDTACSAISRFYGERAVEPKIPRAGAEHEQEVARSETSR